jgi:hypothetical protein
MVAFRSPVSGPATWIISGIHGEEAAGPNAIAAAIDDIAKLGEHRPVVLIPLSNPHGYVRNWRYLNSPVWSENIDAQSVGDSSHLLPDPENSLGRDLSRCSWRGFNVRYIEQSRSTLKLSRQKTSVICITPLSAHADIET